MLASLKMGDGDWHWFRSPSLQESKKWLPNDFYWDMNWIFFPCSEACPFSGTFTPPSTLAAPITRLPFGWPKPVPIASRKKRPPTYYRSQVHRCCRWIRANCGCLDGWWMERACHFSLWHSCLPADRSANSDGGCRLQTKIVLRTALIFGCWWFDQAPPLDWRLHRPEKRQWTDVEKVWGTDLVVSSILILTFWGLNMLCRHHFGRGPRSCCIWTPGQLEKVLWSKQLWPTKLRYQWSHGDFPWGSWASCSQEALGFAPVPWHRSGLGLPR